MIENVRMLDAILSPVMGMRDSLDKLCPLVRKYLADVAREEPITTAQLGERLYPVALAKKDGIYARKRMFEVLCYAASRDLADCAVRGPQRRMKGRARTIRPWLWAQSGDRNREAMEQDRRAAENKFKKDLGHAFGFAVRRLGFHDAKRLADAVIAVYDDPTLAALEAGDLKYEAAQQ